MQGLGVVQHAGEEGGEGVAGDPQGRWNNVQVHHQFGDKERPRRAVQPIDAGQEIAQNAVEAGADDVVGGQPLVLVGRGHKGGAGGPQGVKDDDQKKNAEEAATGRNVMAGPMSEEPRAEGHHGRHDAHSDDKSELAGSAVQCAGEFDIACAEGERHLRLEGAVDHLDHLEGDARDGSCGAKDDDVNGAECVADGEHRSSDVECVADGEGHVGDGGTGELAYFGNAGVVPAEFNPGYVVADQQAEEDRSEDIDRGKDEGCGPWAFAEDYRDKCAGKGEE